MQSIAVSSRLVAGAGLLVGAIVPIGAKAAFVALAFWALTAIPVAVSRGASLSKLVVPAGRPFLAILVFAAYAALSALWSVQPLEAIRSSLGIVGMVLIAGALVRSLEWFDTATVRLIAGWYTIGFVVGMIVLLREINTDYAIFKAIFSSFPSLRPSTNSMIFVSDGVVKYIAPPFGNWSVAGLNLLLWPTLLISNFLWNRREGRLIAPAILLTAVALIFSSEHQTSMIAIIVAACGFALSRYQSKLVHLGIMIGFSIGVIAMVPLSQFAYHHLELHKVSRLTASLQGRIITWGHTADRVAEAPVIGVGARSVPAMSRLEGERPRPSDHVMAPTLSHHSHNMYLQLWFELGAVGAGLILLAGLLVISRVQTLGVGAIGFGNATVLTALILALATWDVWSSWFAATLFLSFVLLRIGDRVAETHDRVPEQQFGNIWLPENWVAWSDRNRVKVMAGVASVIALAFTAGLVVRYNRIVSISGDAFNLAWQVRSSELSEFSGRELTISAEMLSAARDKFAVQIVEGTKSATSAWLPSGVKSKLTVSMPISAAPKSLSLRFVHSAATGTVDEVVISSADARIDGVPIDLCFHCLALAATEKKSKLPANWSFEGAEGILRGYLFNR